MLAASPKNTPLLGAHPNNGNVSIRDFRWSNLVAATIFLLIGGLVGVCLVLQSTVAQEQADVLRLETMSAEHMKIIDKLQAKESSDTKHVEAKETNVAKADEQVSLRDVQKLMAKEASDIKRVESEEAADAKLQNDSAAKETSDLKRVEAVDAADEKRQKAAEAYNTKRFDDAELVEKSASDSADKQLRMVLAKEVSDVKLLGVAERTDINAAQKLAAAGLQKAIAKEASDYKELGAEEKAEASSIQDVQKEEVNVQATLKSQNVQLDELAGDVQTVKDSSAAFLKKLSSKEASDVKNVDAKVQDVKEAGDASLATLSSTEASHYASLKAQESSDIKKLEAKAAAAAAADAAAADAASAAAADAAAHPSLN